MAAPVLIVVFALWPLLAFAGGLAFAPLTGLCALILIGSIKELRPQNYTPWLVVLFAFAAVSSAWSPNPFSLVEFRPLQGDVNVRSEVLRLGLLFVALGVVWAAARRLDGDARVRIGMVAMIGFAVQVILIGLLAVFEPLVLEFFAPMMTNAGEGVQNISRNSLVAVVAAPWLFFALRAWRPDRVGQVLSWSVIAVLAAALAWRGVHAGLLAFAFSAAAILVVRRWPEGGFRILAVGLAGVVLLTPLLFGVVSFGADVNAADSSLTWRRAIWSRVLEVVEASPIYGGGLGVLRSIDDVIASGAFAGDLHIPNHAHSMFVQLWAETGGVGAILAAIVILMAGWRLPAPRTLGVAAYMGAGVFGAVVAVASVYFDLWNEWWWAVCGLMFVLVGVTASQLRSQNAGAPVGEPAMEALKPNTAPVSLSHSLANNFDLLRLVFASCVAVYHIVLLAGVAPELTGENGALSIAAELGVYAFFVLSGYLVYASCERARSVRHYALKRFRRLYPAYLTVILATAAGALIFSAEARADQYAVLEYVGWNLVFLNFIQPNLPGLFEGGSISAVNGALWTLKIEVMFYLVLPGLVWAFHKVGKYRWALAGAIYVGSELWRLVLLNADEGGMFGSWYDTLAHQLPGQMRFFICGIMLYWLRNRRGLILSMAPFAVGLIAISLAVPVLEFVLPISLAVATIWFGLIVPRFINVTRYGDVSYGLYIVHFPVAQALVSVGGAQNAPWAYLYAAISISLALALALWWTVERGFLHRDSAYRMTARDPGNVLPLFQYRRKRDAEGASSESHQELREGA